MTDEEKAGEKYQEHINKENCYVSKSDEEIYTDGFLDGLTEGKPKWHEIESHVKPSREIEKQYMPKTGEKVLLKYHFYNDEEIHYSDGFYNIYDFEFHIPNNVTGRGVCVIAWCKFEE